MALPDHALVVASSVAREPLTPGPAAVCPGTVLHSRQRPVEHRFERAVTMVWLDPDRPDDLFGRHPLWSARRRAPVRFRSRDYGSETSTRSLADQARRDLKPVVGDAPAGPVRMLTQPRSYGWLFNPLTLYFVWGRDSTVDPVGVVAEVTNTPWKERHRYPVPLDAGLHAGFEKLLHVSPFLGLGMRYQLAVRAEADHLRIDVDVLETGPDVASDAPPVLRTLLDLQRQAPTAGVLSKVMLRRPFPTHRVSGAIHLEAAKLWRKGVPYVPRPRRVRAPTVPEPADRESSS